MSSGEINSVVLLVDTSEVHRLLKSRLAHEQVRLICCSKGGEAMELAREHRPSAILLDLDMPEVNGFEVLRMLKEDAVTQQAPVIVLSGQHDSENKVTAFDLGATDYVTKPFDLAELRARLRAALKLDRALRLLSERADVDGLTGLGNRAHFAKRWKEQVSECRRYTLPLAIGLLDIDHFKRINDTWGHPAGDEVLQGFARLIQQECRGHDVACRYGGEEFVLVMPNTTPADGQQVVERVRVALSEVVWPRHPEHPVTISAGVVGTLGGVSNATTGEQWLEMADRNLYAAKNAGRNRVVTAQIDPPMQMAKAG